MTHCKICGLLKPEEWETCPGCVFGINPYKVGRVICRVCGTVVGEHIRIPGNEYYEYVQTCDYCQPKENHSDEDVVEQFHLWIFKENEKPKKILVQRTRKEVREMRKANEKFSRYLQG